MAVPLTDLKQQKMKKLTDETFKTQDQTSSKNLGQNKDNCEGLINLTENKNRKFNK